MVNIIKQEIEVEEARLEYNSKQSTPSRMIDNYFDIVSNNEKKDLACEIFELGDKEYWDTKDDKYNDVVNEMYEENALDDEDIDNLDLSKEKDNFER